MPQYPASELAQLLISLCAVHKIEHIVISPGSRNAPLIVGFHSHPKIKTYSIVDERCAGFFALGMAQQKRTPVALLCTSGSALANYYPAITEAFYSHIPLLIISADRPKKYLDIGDGQTIRQEGFFKNHIGYEANLQESDTSDIAITKISRAINTANDCCLPSHINIPFDEPFYEFKPTLVNTPKPAFKKRKTIDEVSNFAATWNESLKKIVLIGQHYPNDELTALLETLAKDSSVLVVVEHTTNMQHPSFLHSIDKNIFPLNEEEATSFVPDLLITMGSFVVSKMIKTHFRKHTPKHHWHIDEKRSLDTFLCLKKHIDCLPIVFFKALLPKIHMKEPSNFQKTFLDRAVIRSKKHGQFLKNCEFSDLKVMEILLNSIPKNSQLQLGNSSIIRYAQLFKIAKSIQVFCNRGTSGIDGCTSTAIGASVANEQQTTLITGDLSFFYDSNALWNNYIPPNFRIIVVNNGGGGIFRMISGPKNTQAMDYFETPHKLSCKPICELYNFDYLKASNKTELTLTLKDFFEPSEKPKLLEIKTPRSVNDQIFNEYIEYLKNGLDV
jgi:2-succinyl-5-enolpyruvyl-6-hydroxy-3-cyclohexene-1-carboxylate synthase